MWHSHWQRFLVTAKVEIDWTQVAGRQHIQGIRRIRGSFTAVELILDEFWCQKASPSWERGFPGTSTYPGPVVWRGLADVWPFLLGHG
jgi:hypothetical protein